jgi:hypothetical protein
VYCTCSSAIFLVTGGASSHQLATHNSKVFNSCIAFAACSSAVDVLNRWCHHQQRLLHLVTVAQQLKSLEGSGAVLAAHMVCNNRAL